MHDATGSLKFYINYVAPLQGTIGSRHLKVDVTRGEIIEFGLVDCNVFAGYSDIEDDFTVQCYSLSEVIIEKMTALMGRTIPCDVYDLWYLFEIDGMDIEDHNFEFERKAINKGHNPEKFDGKLKTYQRELECQSC